MNEGEIVNEDEGMATPAAPEAFPVDRALKGAVPGCETLYGLLAEFEAPERLVEAADRAREAGYVCMDAYTPMPIEGLDEALGLRRNRLPAIVLAGGLLGLLTAFGMQWYLSVVEYPINIGGRPLNSWPAFVPICFELTVLFAAFAAVLGMLALNGLPMPYHPLFNVPGFAMASRNRFFLCIQADDPKFDLQQTIEFLASLGPRRVSEVPC